MRWEPGEVSGNIEDQRSSGGGFGGRGIGLGGLLIAGVLSLIFGRDFITPLLTSGGGTARTQQEDTARNRAEEPRVKFVSFVLDDAQRNWAKTLGPRYHDAKLVLFRDAVRSGCGTAGAETGPFYCPGDEKVYIDLSFFDELDQRFGAAGDFAQAYVLAHEIGHHVQKVLGISRQVRQLQEQNPGAANPLSVRLELQADCFAGIWGHSTEQRGILEKGDVEEGINAAAAVGDDRIQRQARGTVNPESFTHGSSRQRVEWFQRGFQSGDVKACDTFEGR